MISPDVFYFGNLAGDSDDTLPAAVTAADLFRTRSRLHTADPAELRRHDFNHDGVVNARDLATVRANHGAALPTFTAPASAAAGSVLPGEPIGRSTGSAAPSTRRSVWADLQPEASGVLR